MAGPPEQPCPADDPRLAADKVGIQLVAAMLGSLLLPHADAALRLVPRLRSRLRVPGRPPDDGDED